MTCKHCGTEIAANAMICYRCGHATAEPAAGVPRSAKSRGWVSVVAAVFLIMAALFMGQTTSASVPREVSWAMGALAAIVLAWRLWTRGR